MDNWLTHQAFVAYAISCLILCVNLLFLWGYSGAVRGKVKSTPNVEDVAAFGGSLAEVDPPAVARVLRTHSNAQANIFPFVVVGLLYLLAGGNGGLATIAFGVFTVARLLHSLAYLKQWQPWRTVFYVIGALSTGVLMVNVAWLLVHAA